MAGTIDFKYGTLIRTGPKLINGGKWDAELNEWVRNATTNADLLISISIFFQKIDPAGGKTDGLHEDADTGDIDPATHAAYPKKKILAWRKGEFEHFRSRLVREAQRFWSGVFWLKTPATYTGLDWPDVKPATHRCNLYCKFELTAAASEADGHYTIAVVRVPDSEDFRSHSRLYSQKDIQAEQMIPKSTAKFFTHYHEVGHLLGLGHVGYKDHHNLHADNSAQAYGVTMQDMQDVMGRGTAVHPWHALPWQEAAATFTNTKTTDWQVFMRQHIYPHRLPPVLGHK
jgi:hypothetical protein